ncbi:hypothetical protein PHYBOEH_008130 [Phytophthora boehmeriae]|uniref:CMGC/CDK protein kinase n=1 Tax=Phytophthora boehmeriae TaxID=109152 RepID=A0A8T1W3L6_9STRA|nr:hypothetical protein PHYBOEH_008130 [Phytophthora boehmeriae]
MASSSSSRPRRSRSRSPATSFDQLQALRHVQLIERNEYPLRHLLQDKVRRRARADEEEDEDEATPCFCSHPDQAEREDARRDGRAIRRCDDVSCLNFATYVECPPSCPAGHFCMNQRLQHPEKYPLLEPFRTQHKGYGVRTRQQISQQSIVGEYVGEIIDQKELARRLKSVPRHELNFYYLLLAPGVYIDARNKGSFTRFVNHSCDPNCKTEKWTVKGETRIAVIALRDIQEGEELTFDYQWKALGSRQIKCFCNAANCKGVIGEANDTLQNAEAQGGYFRDPEKQDLGKALVDRRIRVFVSPDEKAEYDIFLVKNYDQEQDRYQVEDLLEPAGYETDEQDREEDASEKQYVQLKENGWQVYCPPGDDETKSVFAIPKKRNLPPSASNSRDPSPKRAGDTTSTSGDTPSPVATLHPPGFASTKPRRNQFGELLDREGRLISNKILVKDVPKNYNARMLRAMFASRKHPDALVDLDVFYFLDGTGWALVELETNELAATYRRMLDHRPLGIKMLRVFPAGQKEINNFNHQKGKTQMMRLQGATDRILPSPTMSPEEKENEQPEEPDKKIPYCFGRKLNWIVTEEELKELPVQQVLSSSLEESLRVKYVKSIFHIAKGLKLDREDATSAIIALNRYFTFNAMPMDVEIYAATMLNLFLKAHARKVSWAAYIKEVYKAKHGAVAVERLTTDSPELGALKRQVVKTEGELLEGLRYDVTGEDVYALLDLLTTRKPPKKIVGINGSNQSFLSSLPPVEVQKEAKHLVSESLRLPIWTRTSVECVMLSIVYVSAAVTEVLKTESPTSMTAIPEFLPQMDLQANRDEAKVLLDCSLLICAQLKDRWTRLENQAKAAQQKKSKPTDSDEFDLEQFDVSRAKDVEISERISQLLKHWINLPVAIPSSVLTALASTATSSAPSSLTNNAATVAAKVTHNVSSTLAEKNFITFKSMGSCLPVSKSSAAQDGETAGTISAKTVFSKKSATRSSSNGSDSFRLHTSEIKKVESIRKRAFIGVISDEVNFDLGDQPVYLQSWPYLEQEVFFTEDKGINEACLRELSAATNLSSLLPDRFMKLQGIVFPAEKKERGVNELETSNDSLNTTINADDLDLIAATIDDEGNPLPHGMDRLDQQKHYLAFEQPLHMFSGIFEARVALAPELRKKAIFDMLQSLAAVHDQGYVHRFVALSHLLVFHHGIKLGGYHAMRKIAALKPKEGEVMWTAAYDMSDAERKAHCYGAWLHVSAPEILLGETKYTWRADVWSAGCVALAILLEKVPFLQGQDAKIQLDLIYRLCGTPNTTWEGACKLPLYNTFRPKHEYKMRLRKTLLEQRAKFPDFPEDAVEVLESMLQLDPSKRSPIKKLLEMRYFDSVRSGEQLIDFSGLPPTFPVQKKKLVQHLIKSKAKKRRISASGRSTSSSHHHRSSRGHGSSSEPHRRKRTSSFAHEDSATRGDKRHHHEHRRSKSDKHKSRSQSTLRREGEITNGTEDVEMQDASEYVPLPASFVSSSATSSALAANDNLPSREKREKLGWGMGLNPV